MLEDARKRSDSHSVDTLTLDTYARGGTIGVVVVTIQSLQDMQGIGVNQMTDELVVIGSWLTVGVILLVVMTHCTDYVSVHVELTSRALEVITLVVGN